MSFKNTAKKFGSLTKILHWSIFLLFCLQYFLIYRRNFFEDNAPEKLEYIFLHKSVGMLLFMLALLMLIWRHFGQRPSYPGQPAPWEIFLSKVTHGLLYVVMLAMPLTGMLMSQLSGYGMKFFGLQVPNPFEVNKELSSLFHDAHEITGWVIIALVSLHLLAALYHHFIKKDNVLKRMLPFGRPH